jgi:hypothetical protein
VPARAGSVFLVSDRAEHWDVWFKLAKGKCLEKREVWLDLKWVKMEDFEQGRRCYEKQWKRAKLSFCRY